MSTTPRGPYRKTAARRTAILDAARHVFARSGFHAATLREIAERVGISQGAVLHHFGDKTAVLTALLDRRDEIARTFFTGPRGIDTLLAAVEVIHSNVQERSTVEVYCTLSAESTSPGHPAHDYFVNRYEYNRSVLDDALTTLRAQGQLAAGTDIAAAASSALALMDGIQLQWLLDPDAVDPVQIIESHLRSFVTGDTWEQGIAAREERHRQMLNNETE